MSWALQSVKGVLKAEASFKDKRAVIVLDEAKTPLSALLTVKTRYHPFRLTPLLPVDKTSREKAIQALKAVKGVKEVKAVDDGVAVTLNPDATVRYGDLLAALQKAGITLRDLSKQPQEKQRQENQQGAQGSSNCCGQCSL